MTLLSHLYHQEMLLNLVVQLFLSHLVENLLVLRENDLLLFKQGSATGTTS